MSISVATMSPVACSISDRRARLTDAGCRHLMGVRGVEAAQVAKARRAKEMIASLMPTRSTLSRGHETNQGARRQMCAANGEGRPLSPHRGDAALLQPSREAGLSKTTSQHSPDRVEPVVGDSLGRYDRLADSHLSSHREKRGVFAPRSGGA
jgi:hypothetical protein